MVVNPILGMVHGKMVYPIALRKKKVNVKKIKSKKGKPTSGNLM